MNLDSELVNTTLHLQVLPAPGPVFEVRVEAVAGRRVLVKCECVLKVGAAVQLDALDRMLLAEVLSFERSTDGTRALLDVQHSLLYADVEQIGSRRGAPQAPDSRTDTTGA
jgi:hypothetical protein